MRNIILTKERETLFIPLFGKAIQMKKKTPILVDNKAVEILNQINYDFSLLKIPEKTNIMMCIRAKLIDDYVRDVLTYTDSVVLHLGCGLDSRYHRIENSHVDWYDIDFEEVIDIRRMFYDETDKYFMIPSSVTDKDLLAKIPVGKTQYIVIAEGLFMYLKEDDVKALLRDIKEKLGSYTLIFDVFSVYTAKKIKNHPSLKKTGAVIQWGIDHSDELNNWGLDIEEITEHYFTSSKEINKLDLWMKIVFKFADLFNFAKKAHRILSCKII